jgi:hypothetical protein
LKEYFYGLFSINTTLFPGLYWPIGYEIIENLTTTVFSFPRIEWLIVRKDSSFDHKLDLNLPFFKEWI